MKMRQTDLRRLEQLATWRPEHGVISIFFDIDPGDRSGSWRLALKDGLNELREPQEHDAKLAMRETVKRVLERFDPDDEPPSGRSQIGFVEVARKEGREDWSSMQIESRLALVRHGPRALLLPMFDLLARARPRPVLAVSAERVRGWIWSEGKLEPRPGWDAELAIYEGHERKAPAMADPARGQATSSSGRDQFGQRLEENRKRFLRDLAKQVSEDTRLNGSELFAIGEAPYLDDFASALPAGLDVHRVEGPDVIGEKEEAIAERIGPAIDQALARREQELAKGAIDAAMASEGRGATGVNEVSEALVEGRVEQLLLDPSYEIALADLSPTMRENVSDGEALGGAELMVEQALRTSAVVIPVANEAAEALREHGGAAALLRY
jgi:release factor family 5